MDDLRRYNHYIQSLIDVASLIIALILVRVVSFNITQFTGAYYPEEPYQRLFLMVVVAYILVNTLTMFNEDFTYVNNRTEMHAAFSMVLHVNVIVIIYMFMSKVSYDYSRIFIGVFSIVAFVLNFLMRIVVKKRILHLYQRSSSAEKIVVIGTEKAVTKMLGRIETADDWRFKICGLVITDQDRKGEYIGEYDIISNADDMYYDIMRSGVDSCLLASDVLNSSFREWVARFNSLGKVVHVNINEMGLNPKSNYKIGKVGECGVVSYYPVLRIPKRQELLKRVMDIGASILFIPFFLVFLILSLVFTSLESRGPVMNNRIRIGKFGRRYYQHRFRCYRMDAEARIAAGKSPYTLWGRFLRTTHLDGLPQIVDVLNGDMSFIGPRSPSLTGFLSYSPEQISNLCCKPGIVGYWSCQTDIRDVTEDDRAYVENWNFFRECGILLESVIRYLTFHSTRKFYRQYLVEWEQEELQLIRDYEESIRPLEYDRTRYQARDGASYRAYLIIKRAFDIVASLLAIILLSIPLLILVILVIADDGGAPFYGHSRIGLRGKRIRVFKFRSMRSDAGNLEKLLTPEQLKQYWTEFKVDNDPRITKIGNFLRRTSLDELPQLYNILRGDLSVVGPRPIVEKETHIYGDEIGKLLSVKPGLTGYWQAYARNNATYESGERQKMEMYYVDHCSLLLDIRIIFRTVFSVLKREGAQ